MESLKTFCRDAAAGREETLILSEEELVVTMQGILKYPVLQQGRVLCQWRKQREDKKPRLPVQEEKSETVPSESRQRAEDASITGECFRKDLLAEEQTKGSDTELVSRSSSSASVVQSYPSSTAARQHHNEVAGACPDSEGGIWNPRQLTPRKDDVEEEVENAVTKTEPHGMT
jgi:hypothetical protein